MLNYVYTYFLTFFFLICFSSKHLYWYHFRFFFWSSIKFPQQNINQSESGIGDTKLSVELFARAGSLLSPCYRSGDVRLHLIWKFGPYSHLIELLFYIGHEFINFCFDCANNVIKDAIRAKHIPYRGKKTRGKVTSFRR